VEVPAATGRSILCLIVMPSSGFVRELLRRAGYDVHTSSHVGDALLLMRVTRFDLLLAASGLTASAPQAFRTACAKLPIGRTEQ